MKTRIILQTVLVMLVIAQALHAAAADQYNVPADRLAVVGYDPVSYFDGKPTKGDERWTLKIDGIVYRFASDSNLQRFITEPAKFKPTYGGWCATAMAKGEKVEIDPLNYKITDGRLFLFYNGFWGNAIKDWNKSESKLTTDADRSWKKISGE